MSADPGPIRILSVDDHPLLRQGVAALVGGQADMRRSISIDALDMSKSRHLMPNRTHITGSKNSWSSVI